MMRVVVWLFLFCLTPVWAISYTVQVVAFSDEPRARRVQTELSSQGYPAYLLAVPTAQGQVYRIRVGAFANRAAAALFAEAMPSVEGSTPSPALAEGGVPPGLIPFEPALLGQYDLTTTLVQVFPWPTKSESSAPNVAPQQAAPQQVAPQQASSEETTATAASETSGQETGQDSATQPASDEQQASETTTETSTETDATNPDVTNTDTSTPNESSEQTTSERATVTPTSSPGGTSATTTGSELNAQAEETQQTVTQPPMAIRVQPRDASEQAHYRIGELEFDAWKAAPADTASSDTASSNAASGNTGEIVRVRSLSVWPEEWQSISEAERDQYRETVLANVAGELDLTPQQLEPFVFELADKAPFVVLVERFNLETQQTERLRAIGQPRPNEDNLGLRNDGPSSFFGESVQIPLPEASTVFEPSSSSQAPDELMGNGWLASSDGDYVNLTVAGKTWRAAIGEPLWASGDLLISIHDNQVLIYQFK
jgi:SPOR domain